MRRVLIACEFSGIVREAFKLQGWDAWSCDLLPTEIPGLHYQGDVLNILDGFVPIRHQCECDPEGNNICNLTNNDTSTCSCLGPTQDDVEYKEINGVLFGRPFAHPNWDLLIGHPPCTYLSSSGLHWNKRRPERAKLTEEALVFFKQLLEAPIPHICIENPIGCVSSRIRKPDQIIQPHYFGENASKSTCLWTKNLPHLIPTDKLELPKCGYWENQTKNGQNKLGPSPDRWKLRSKTYEGIAKAMSQQWTEYFDVAINRLSAREKI